MRSQAETIARSRPLLKFYYYPVRVKAFSHAVAFGTYLLHLKKSSAKIQRFIFLARSVDAAKGNVDQEYVNTKKTKYRPSPHDYEADPQSEACEPKSTDDPKKGAVVEALVGSDHFVKTGLGAA